MEKLFTDLKQAVNEFKKIVFLIHIISKTEKTFTIEVQNQSSSSVFNDGK